jgi:glycosyltransferase involved in cell wall biosynthesis
MLIDRLQVGGPGQVTVAAALGLRSRGQDVRVAHLGVGDWQPLAERLRAGGVPTFKLPVSQLFDPIPIVRFAGYLRRERVDLVHTHNRYAHLIGRAAAALAGRPVVSTVHYLVEDGGGRREAIRRQLDFLTARLACARLIMVCQAQRGIFSRASGLRASKLLTLLNGVDCAAFRPDPLTRARLRAELGLAADATFYVTVGVLRPLKAIEDLLTALAALGPAEGPVHGLVVGDGPERGRLEAQARALGLNERVHFTGTRLDVAALLAAADVYVHPSRLEALPTSILEAMAAGLAVVATRVGGVPEIVQDGQTGLLVPAGRPLELAAALRTLLDPERRIELGRAAREWALNHASLERWLDQLQALYREVAGRAGAGAGPRYRLQ